MLMAYAHLRNSRRGNHDSVDKLAEFDKADSWAAADQQPCASLAWHHPGGEQECRFVLPSDEDMFDASMLILTGQTKAQRAWGFVV